MYREVGYYWLRLLIYGALALSLGTLFFDIGSSSESIQVKHGVWGRVWVIMHKLEHKLVYHFYVIIPRKANFKA